VLVGIPPALTNTIPGSNPTVLGTPTTALPDVVTTGVNVT
jgi:hypothetical protein